MWYLERVPGASRIASVLTVIAVVTAAVVLAMIGVYATSTLHIVNSVDGAGSASQAGVVEYRAQVAAATAAEQGLVDDIKGIVVSASDYGLNTSVDPARSEESNLMGFRAAYCDAVSGVNLADIPSINFIARTAYERFQARGLLPSGDFETAVLRESCG